MARWTPRSPKESLESSRDRMRKRLEDKKKEVKELEDQIRQVDQAIKALSV